MNRFSISIIIYRPKKLPKIRRFNNLAEIWLEGDHYKWRALRANGIPEELVTGNGDPKEKYLAWAATIPHTLGNPLYHWTHLELKRVFRYRPPSIPRYRRRDLGPGKEKLAEPDFSARGMLERFQVKALCTTDDPAHPLSYHEEIAQSIPTCKVYPTFRPDQAWGIDQARISFNGLKPSNKLGKTIVNFDSFLQALQRGCKNFTN